MSTRPITVTIQETAQAMAELSLGEDPSMLHALRAASLCLRMQLRCSNGFARELYHWRDEPLPEDDMLLYVWSTALRSDGSGKPAWGLMQSHLSTLRAIDNFWFQSGLRDLAYDYGETLD